MRPFLKCFAPLMLAAALTAPALTGCAVHARVYDSYGHQYRAWAPEQPHYNQWEQETHRKHEDFKKRSKSEQDEYWQWRNQHGG